MKAEKLRKQKKITGLWGFFQASKWVTGACVETTDRIYLDYKSMWGNLLQCDKVSVKYHIGL